MKTLVAFGLGLLLNAAHRATGATVEFNKGIARSYADRHGISFQAVDSSPLPANLLMEAMHDDSERLACSLSSNVTSGDKKVTVLIAVSKCLNESSIRMIKEWVKTVKDTSFYDFVKPANAPKLQFNIAVVPGACEARTEMEKHGRAETTPAEEQLQSLMATDVDASDVKRFSSLAQYGRVLAGLSRSGGSKPATDPSDTPDAESKSDIPIGVISFVNDKYSLQEVEQYEREFKISNVFNFQMCDGGVSCQGKFENCIQLAENVDIFMYNPFTVARTLDCSTTLGGGIPITYVGHDGSRQCFCSCPAGTKKEDGEYGPSCTKVSDEVCPCVWSNHLQHGFRIGVGEPKNGQYDVCEIKHLASEHGIPVPFPTDNYVADYRANAKDVSGPVESGPRIKLSTYKLNDVVFDDDGTLPPPEKCSTLPTGVDEFKASHGMKTVTESSDSVLVGPTHYFNWVDYQTNRQDKIDDLVYGSYGKYSLNLEAKDYSDKATCEGCVAVVDAYRPQNTSACPVGFCDNTTSVCGGPHGVPTSELTIANLQKAHELVQHYYDFAANASNDKCTPEADNRCDEQTFEERDIFQRDFKDGTHSDGRGFFSVETTIAAFTGSEEAAKSPLVETDAYKTVVRQCSEPVPAGQCTRCVKLSTTLKEYWVDYKCGFDYDIQRCSGTGAEAQTCKFSQCLVVNGDTFVNAAATIKPALVEESDKVLAQLVQQGFQSHTQIHRALNCTNLNNGQDADCLFASKISDLLDVSVTAKPELGDHDVSKYVFWRYKVGNGAWKLMNDATAEEFAGAETKIFVEAWTQCGVARKFLFSVNLHAHTAVTVCDEFKNMWYQSSVSRLPIDSHVCTYEKSDFAELTFDYHPNIGLRYSRDRLSLNVSQVVCKIKLEGHSSAQLLNVTQKSPEIVSRFAIEALNNDVTAETTAFNISCSFTYSRYDATTLTKTCKKRFEIQDCTKPEIDNPKPPQGECAFDECAGNGLPGPFEACGGTIVKSSPAYEADGKTVKAKTSVVTGNKACCNMCESYQLSCNALLNLPDESEDIMRCEPVSHEGGGVYGDNTYGDNTYSNTYSNSYSNSYTTALMSAGHALLNAGKQNTGAAALLGASALVALVALVAVKRRRSAAATKLDMVEDDAYYPLLS